MEKNLDRLKAKATASELVLIEYMESEIGPAIKNKMIQNFRDHLDRRLIGKLHRELGGTVVSIEDIKKAIDCFNP